MWQSKTLRYSAARQSRNQIVIVLLLVLALDCPISDEENKDDDEDERLARPATIWTDADRVQLWATEAALSTCPAGSTLLDERRSIMK